MMPVSVVETWAVVGLVVAHEIGKAGTHALRDREWARIELIPGLAISDAYHVCSGLQWLVVAWAMMCAYGSPVGPCWQYWLAALLLCGLVWPASKALKYPGLTFGAWFRRAVLEAWYVQVILWPWRWWRG